MKKGRLGSVEKVCDDENRKGWAGEGGGQFYAQIVKPINKSENPLEMENPIINA